jgi:APA family basic amino acid/polyamine antiporter
MARDRVFFAPAATLHARYHTPAISIAAQAAWSSVLVVSGSADALIRYTGFAVVLFSGVAVAALFVLRARDRIARPFTTWGYPVTPAVFAGAMFAIVVNAVYRDPVPSGAGILIIAAGIPVYGLFALRARSARAINDRATPTPAVDRS